MAGISNHWDTISVLKGVVDALALTGLKGGAVIQEVATYLDTQIPLPFVSISPYGPEKTPDDESFTNRDETDYVTLVAIIGNSSVTDLEQRLAWRQTLRRNFNNHSLNDLITLYSLPNPVLNLNYNLRVEMGNVVEPRAWFDRDNAFVSGFLVRSMFQEPRV